MGALRCLGAVNLTCLHSKPHNKPAVLWVLRAGVSSNRTRKPQELMVVAIHSWTWRHCARISAACSLLYFAHPSFRQQKLLNNQQDIGDVTHVPEARNTASCNQTWTYFGFAARSAASRLRRRRRRARTTILSLVSTDRASSSCCLPSGPGPPPPGPFPKASYECGFVFFSFVRCYRRRKRKTKSHRRRKKQWSNHLMTAPGASSRNN